MTDLTEIAGVLRAQNALLRELVDEVRRLRREPQSGLRLVGEEGPEVTHSQTPPSTEGLANGVDEPFGAAIYGVDPATGRIGWLG